jgi:hypothetical protein
MAEACTRLPGPMEAGNGWDCPGSWGVVSEAHRGTITPKKNCWLIKCRQVASWGRRGDYDFVIGTLLVWRVASSANPRRTRGSMPNMSPAYGQSDLVVDYFHRHERWWCFALVQGQMKFIAHPAAKPYSSQGQRQVGWP